MSDDVTTNSPPEETVENKPKRFYNDLYDLIQNQRILAEQVWGINADYEKIKEDIEFAKTLETRINELDTTLTTTLAEFDQKISQSDDEFKKSVEDLKAVADELKKNAESFANIATSTQDFAVLLDELYYIKSFRTSWDDVMARIAELELQCNSIIIMEKGHEVPVEERRDHILYGKITDELRDFELGLGLKLSPFLQGVIVDPTESEGK